MSSFPLKYTLKKSEIFLTGFWQKTSGKSWGGLRLFPLVCTGVFLALGLCFQACSRCRWLCENAPFFTSVPACLLSLRYSCTGPRASRSCCSRSCAALQPAMNSSACAGVVRPYPCEVPSAMGDTCRIASASP